MNYTDLINRIEYLYSIVAKTEEKYIDFLVENNRYDGERITQEQFDYSQQYEKLKEILVPMIEQYQTVLANPSISGKAQKVFFVAMCEMIKQDYSRGMLITFRYVTNKDLNVNRYYDLLTKVSNSQGLNLITKNGRRLFEESYILETGIPKNLTTYVMRMFRIYWKYFRELQKTERCEIVRSYFKGVEFTEEYIIDVYEARTFEECRNKMVDFSEKASRVFFRLDDIFEALDEYTDRLFESKYQNEIFENISNMLGYDITCVIRNSDLAKVYSTYLCQIPVSKFQKILFNLPKAEMVINPFGDKVRVEAMLSSTLVCGEYFLRGNKYEVVISPTISLENMLKTPCNILQELSTDYYIYSSRNFFDVEVDGKIVNVRELYYKGQSRFIWIGKLPPASKAIIDGKELLSSQKVKFSGKIIKKYDPETNQSRLIYYIGTLKYNNPERKYERLYYKLNEHLGEMIAIGSPTGIFYCENIRIELPASHDHLIDFICDNKSILDEPQSVIFEDTYLFDKWHGTRYVASEENENHSGAFIYFSKKSLTPNEINYTITSQYNWHDYNVIEFSAPINEKVIKLDDTSYYFGSAGKPGFFFVTEESELTTLDSLNDLKVRFYNLKETEEYRFSAECGDSRYIAYVTNGEYSFINLFENDDISDNGKWTCSLWHKQIKVEENKFTLIPKIEVLQDDVATLEGNDVFVTIQANTSCFVSDVGEYTNTIRMNIGSAALMIDNETPTAERLKNYVYIDELAVVKEIEIEPAVWGVRVKDSLSPEWVRKELVVVDSAKKENANISIFSTVQHIVYVNGIETIVKKGINVLPWMTFIKSFKRKSDLVITDDKYTLKKIFGCTPKYEVEEIDINDSVIISIKYDGPIDEVLKICTFIDGKLIKTNRREAEKNIFSFDIVVGYTNMVKGKNVSIEILDSKSDIPTVVFSDVINYEEQNTKDDLVNRDNRTDIVKVNSPEEMVKVENLIEWYYQIDATGAEQFDISRIIKYMGL